MHLLLQIFVGAAVSISCPQPQRIASAELRGLHVQSAEVCVVRRQRAWRALIVA
jgi:hypothetical protein